MKLKWTTKNNGTETIVKLDDTILNRIACHLEISTEHVEAIFKSGKGIQTDFSYYEPIKEQS